MIQPVPKPTPRRLQKARTARQKAAKDRAVYQRVTERDGSRCRVCGSGQQIHRHHLRGRKYTTTKDCICVCAVCHAGLHPRVGGKWLHVEGDGDGQLTIGIRLAGKWVTATV